jgi:hypothetical protein
MAGPIIPTEVLAAVAAEREACARLVENFPVSTIQLQEEDVDDADLTLEKAARAIRARRKESP